MKTLPEQLRKKILHACALRDSGDLSSAEDVLGEVLKLAPRNFEALVALGFIMLRRRNHSQAAELFGRLVKIAPQRAEAYLWRGNALHGSGEMQPALISFNRAITMKPDLVDAHMGRGNVLYARGDLQAALDAYDKAISLSASASAYSNRGVVLKDMHRLEEALASFDRAIELQPGLPMPYVYRGFTHLLAGDLLQGWRDCEWRLHGSAYADSPRRWRGELPIADKTFLLRIEQGYGDTIQFSRYATTLAARGARVVLEVQPTLVNLLARIEGVSDVIPIGSTVPEFDYECSLLSLPLACATDLDNIPATTPYLSVPRALRQCWLERLGPRSRPRIGLAWGTSSTSSTGAIRSIPLELLLRHLPEPFDYIALQTHIPEPDQQTLARNPQVRSLAAEHVDFADNAALVECMDLVISVDTSIAHLSGAAGRPTWLLLPFNPDWRWMLGRRDSPWYPTMTLYRQPRPGDWSAVLMEVSSALHAVDFPGRPG